MFCTFDTPDHAEQILESIGFWKDQNNAVKKDDAEIRIYGPTHNGRWLIEVVTGCSGILEALKPWLLEKHQTT